MYESLTALLPRLEKGPYATLPEQTGDGSPERPYVMLQYVYNDAVKDLIYEVRAFAKEHDEMKLNDYRAALESAGIPVKGDVLEQADVSSLDGKTVVAMIIAVIRAERFTNGVILRFCENGCIRRWLERLKEIDEQAETCGETGELQTVLESTGVGTRRR